jgi:hypothetical protein
MAPVLPEVEAAALQRLVEHLFRAADAAAVAEACDLFMQ